MREEWVRVKKEGMKAKQQTGRDLKARQTHSRQGVAAKDR